MLLGDVPVDAIGIPWQQWMEQQPERILLSVRPRLHNRRWFSNHTALAYTGLSSGFADRGCRACLRGKQTI
jgi:hypothetical protein